METKLRRFLVVVAALGLMLSALPTMAGATDLGSSFTVDLYGDGALELVQLGQVGGPTSTTCTVTVSRPVRTGYGPPVVYTYTSPLNGPYCPDIGVAMTLGNDTVPSLVTASSVGYGQLVVLHNFLPVAIFAGIPKPYWLHTGDLNADGRQDLIEWSGQTDVMSTLLNNPDGTLAGSPITVPCVAAPAQYVVANMIRDVPEQDIFVSDGCPPGMGTWSGTRAVIYYSNGVTPPTVLTDTTIFPVNWIVSAPLYFRTNVHWAEVEQISAIGPPSWLYWQNEGGGHFIPSLSDPSA